MAQQISYDFDELKSYLKRLEIADDQALNGDRVSAVVGPASYLSTTASYRFALSEMARSFGRYIDNATIGFAALHATLVDALNQAIETNDANADDIRQLMAAIEDSDHAIAPAKAIKPVGATKTAVADTAAGVIE